MTIGDEVLPLQWQARTAGSAIYASDVQLPGMLHAKVLRSPLPSARIRSIDTSEALQSPGVCGVITGRDLPDRMYHHLGGPLSDRYPLARGEVRFIGEEVAAVAAETPEQAEAACRLIAVEYEWRRGPLTVPDARRGKYVPVHSQRPDNVAASVVRTYGDIERVRSTADEVVSGSFTYSRAAHASMEPHSIVASWNETDARLDLWVSHQAPWFVRHEVADILGLEIDQVHTHEVAVGGSFGVKAKVCEHEVLASALSILTKRPVRLVLDRREEFSATKTRHPYFVTAETGADAAGHLMFRDVSMVVDNGAYNHNGPSVPGYSAILAGSLYRLDAARAGFELLYTNSEPGGSFRGYGNPQLTFALEQQVDEVAERLGMDPIDLRVLNANRTGDTTLTGWHLESARLVECLRMAREAIGWDAKRSQGGSGRGVGIAAAVHVSGANAYDHAEESAAALDLFEDGTLRLRFAGADAGTGQRTVLAQVVATELAVPIERVHVVMMASEGTPRDLGAWSSRGTFMSGHSVRITARRMAAQLRDLAAAEFCVDAETVELINGCAVAASSQIDIGNLVRLGEGTQEGRITVEGTYRTSASKMDRETGTGHFSETYAFAAQAVEVDVDFATGKVSVLRAVSVHDCGSVVNPIAARSQVIGGLAMGLGAALGEELLYEQGRMINSRYADYALPRAEDVPELTALFIDEKDPVGPYGAKSLGEICVVPTPAAVANAVAHAVGVRIRETPLSPDRVLNALNTRTDVRRGRGVMLRPRRWWVALVRAAYPWGLHSFLHRFGTRWAATVGDGVDQLTHVDSVGEVIAALQRNPAAAVLGGGTDLLPLRRDGIRGSKELVDVMPVDDLHGIRIDVEGNLHIGATTTLAEVSDWATGGPWEVLAATIETIAGPQVRAMATVAGNLCQEKRCPYFRNGFPCYKRGGSTCPCYAILGDHRHHHAVLGAHRCQAVTPSDLATTLVALDAEAAVQGSTRRATVKMADLYRGPGETVLRPDELITEVVIPAAGARRVNRFEKLQLWSGDFAIVAVATSLAMDAGQITDGRVVLGGVAPVPWRARRVERLLEGQRLDSEQAQSAAAAWERDTHPLPHNGWKVSAATGLIDRCLTRSRQSPSVDGGAQ